MKNMLLRITLLAAILFFSVLYLSAVGPYWKITPDSTAYVSAAESLAAGEGYGQSRFLPMTSLIFSIFIMLFPDGYLALNALTTVFALLSFYLCLVLFKKDVGLPKALIIVLLSLGSIFLFRVSTFLLSDFFYMFFSFLALVLIRYNLEKEGGMLVNVLIAIIVLAACMTRITGLAIVLAIIINEAFSIFSRKTRIKPNMILMMSVVLLIVFLWEYRSSLLSHSYFTLYFQNEPWVEEYGYISLIGLVKRFFLNLGKLGIVLTNDVFENFGVIQRYAIALTLSLFLPLFCLGVFISNRRSPTVMAVYTLLYLLTIIMFDTLTRYFVPVLPLLFYYALVGLENMIEKARAGAFAPKIIHAGVGLYILCYMGYGVIHMLRDIPQEHESPFGAYPIKYTYDYEIRQDIQRLAMWLKDNSAPGESYISHHPQIMDNFTGREGYNFPYSHDPNKLLELLKEKKIRYLLVEKNKDKVQDFLLPVINAYPNQFDLIRNEKDASLYEFKLQEPPRNK